MTVLDACWNELSSLPAALSWCAGLGFLAEGEITCWSCAGLDWDPSIGLKEPWRLLGVWGALVAATSGTSPAGVLCIAPVNCWSVEPDFLSPCFGRLPLLDVAFWFTEEDFGVAAAGLDWAVGLSLF